MTIYLATATRNALADDITTAIDAGAGAGTLKIYNGTRPTNADTAVGAQTLLATVTLENPSFGAASAGVITIVDPASVSGVADGTATWCRVADSNGATVLDGNVTATGGGGFLELSTPAITNGGAVDVTGGTITMPDGT